MPSDILVISWWSNCLGLACLDRLQVAGDADAAVLTVLQIGKSRHARDAFRRLLPAHVRELVYPEDRPCEHGAVLDWVVREALAKAPGIWFVDHDVLLGAELATWMDHHEAIARHRGAALSHRLQRPGQPLTQPAFFVAPPRLPQGTPAFDMVPTRRFSVSASPFDPAAWPADTPVGPPEQDTLEAASRFLRDRGMLCEFDAATFPSHDHLGRLYLLARRAAPAGAERVVTDAARRLDRFFRNCPAEWVAAEDPVLLERVRFFAG